MAFWQFDSRQTIARPHIRDISVIKFNKLKVYCICSTASRLCCWPLIQSKTFLIFPTRLNLKCHFEAPLILRMDFFFVFSVDGQTTGVDPLGLRCIVLCLRTDDGNDEDVGAEMPKRTGIFLLFTGCERTALEGMSNFPTPPHSDSRKSHSHRTYQSAPQSYTLRNASETFIYSFYSYKKLVS